MFSEAAEDVRIHYTTTKQRNLEELGRRLKVLATFFAPYRLAAMDTATIARYQAARQAQGRAGATINRETAVLKRLLKLAARNRKGLAILACP